MSNGCLWSIAWNFSREICWMWSQNQEWWDCDVIDTNCFHSFRIIVSLFLEQNYYELWCMSLTNVVCWIKCDMTVQTEDALNKNQISDLVQIRFFGRWKDQICPFRLSRKNVWLAAVDSFRSETSHLSEKYICKIQLLPLLLCKLLK